MLSRLRSRFSRSSRHASLEQFWALNHKVEDLYQRLEHLEQRVGDEMAAAAAGYLLEFRRRVEVLDATTRSMALAARQHTEEATAASFTAAVSAAREHTEASSNEAISTAIRASREHTDAATSAAVRSAIAASKEHAEALSDVMRTDLVVQLDAARRQLDLIRRGQRAARSGRTAPGAPPRAAPAAAPAPEIDSAFYVALEDRFRGPQETIEALQARYLTHLDGIVDADHPVLDLGSGRGEWLRVLHDNGYEAFGIDSNPVAVAECVESGLKVTEADLRDALASAATESVGAITMLQVVEHLPFPTLLEVFHEVARVLRPGGLLIVETPNALNLQVAATNFWLDPTHQHPLHPELLHLIAKETGFARSEGLFMNRLGPEPDLAGVDEAARAFLERLLETLDRPGDFVLLAWTPTTS